MRDFDKEREDTLAGMTAEDRQFRLRGQVFEVAAGVRPEVIAAWDDLTPGQLVPDDDGAPGDVRPMTSVEFIAGIDECLCSFLASDDDRERWRELRAAVDDPITQHELRSVMQFAIEVVSGRPLERQSPSSGSLAPTGTFSTVGSPS
jgi:hypothetical protein